MKNTPSSVSRCRHCQFYSPEGRRGGQCHRLNVAVKGQWEACNIAVPAFAVAWEQLESIALWKQRILMQQETVVLKSVIADDTEGYATVPTRLEPRPNALRAASLSGVSSSEMRAS